MPKLDQQRVQKAIDRAYDAEVANLFKTFLENVVEAGGTGGVSARQNNVSVLSRAI